MKLSGGFSEKNSSLAANIGKKVLSADENDILYCQLTIGLGAERRYIQKKLAFMTTGGNADSAQGLLESAQINSMHETLSTIWKSLVSQKLLLVLNPRDSAHGVSGNITDHEADHILDLLSSSGDEHGLLTALRAMSTRRPTIILLDNVSWLSKATFDRLSAQLRNMGLGLNVSMLYCSLAQFSKPGSFGIIDESSEYEGMIIRHLKYWLTFLLQIV